MVDQLFNTRFQLIRQFQLIGLSAFAAACLTLTLQGSTVCAQSPAATGENTEAVLAKVGQAKLVRAIYESTKTVKTSKQLTAFVAQCDAALEHKLTSKNTDYVTSLKGWALNLRGQKRMALAMQLRQVGNSQYEPALAQAMKDFDDAILNAPDRYRSWMSRGIAFAQNGDFKNAALNFTTVIKLKTDLGDGWFNRAESLYHLGQFEAAIADYEMVLRLKSDDPQALTGIGHSQLALGKTALALSDYQAVAKLQPGNPNVYVNLGDAFQELGKWKSAQENFDKAISLKPTGVALQRSAWLKATCPDKSFSNPEQAIQLANQAIELNGDSHVNLDTLAAAQAASGKYGIARTTQQKAIVLVTAIDSAESETDGTGVYQARLALYEEEKPFIQTLSGQKETP